MNAKIRMILAQAGRLSVAVDSLSDDQDLYAVGLTSFASVQVMLAIEDAFDIDFPEQLLKRKTFATIAAIEASVASIAERRANAA